MPGEFGDLSLREKTAWAMSVLLTAAGAFYAWEVGGAWLAGGAAPPPSIKLAWVYVCIVVAGAIISMSTLGASDPKGADQRPDERERVVLDRAGNWSGYILAAGVIGGLLHYYVHRDGNLLFHAATAGLMFSQIAEYVFQITLYRRGP